MLKRGGLTSDVVRGAKTMLAIHPSHHRRLLKSSRSGNSPEGAVPRLSPHSSSRDTLKVRYTDRVHTYSSRLLLRSGTRDSCFTCADAVHFFNVQPLRCFLDLAEDLYRSTLVCSSTHSSRSVDSKALQMHESSSVNVDEADNCITPTRQTSSSQKHSTLS